jgi:hypothetical protein
VNFQSSDAEGDSKATDILQVSFDEAQPSFDAIKISVSPQSSTESVDGDEDTGHSLVNRTLLFDETNSNWNDSQLDESQ